MKNIVMGLAAVLATAVLATATGGASASPLARAGMIQAPEPAVSDAQYIERRVIRRGPRGRIVERRVIRPRGRICRVDVVRRFTPRGVVVERVRRCR